MVAIIRNWKSRGVELTFLIACIVLVLTFVGAPLGVQAQSRIRARELKPPSKAPRAPKATPTPQPAETPEPTPEPTPSPTPTPAKEFEGSVEASVALTSGNTSTQSWGGATELYYRPSRWEYQLKSSYINSSNLSIPTAENFTFDVRGGRRLTERSDVFTEFLYHNNRFAGIDHRVIPEFGHGYEWILADPVQLRTETALGYTFEDRTDGTLFKYLSGRLGFLFAWRFSETAGFSHETSLFPSLERAREWRARSETEIYTEATKGLTLKFTYRYDYNNAPVPGTSAEDTRTTTSINVRF